MGWLTKWKEGEGLVVDLSGEMESAAERFAVVDLDGGTRVKVKLRRGDVGRVARGDRVRFVYAPENRTKAVKRIEVVEGRGG